MKLNLSRTRSARISVSILAISLMLGMAACTVQPLNGTTFAGPTVGRSITFSGFSNTPEALISVQILDGPEQDPRSADSTWTTVATTSADSDATDGTVDGELFAWEVEATLVANEDDQDLWPEGGLTRVRVLQDGWPMRTFDDQVCFAEHLGESIADIASICASHDSGVLTLVDIDVELDASDDPDDIDILLPIEDFITYKIDSDNSGREYYKKVDAGPNDARYTFSGWLNANGFERQFYLYDLLAEPQTNNGAPPDLDLPDGRINLSASVPLDESLADLDTLLELHAVDATQLDTTFGLSWQSTSTQRSLMQAVGIDSSVATFNDVLASFGGASLFTGSSPMTSSQISAGTAADPSLDDLLDRQDRIDAATSPPELDDVTAIYRNAGDLGFGREMHCRQKDDGGAACFVTNYGTPDTPASESLADAIRHRNPVATVAMEYVPSAVQNKVRFYAYDGRGQRLVKVDLDSQGKKKFPGVCLACHQGKYKPDTHNVSGARFLPFDLDTFEYTSESGYTRADQEDAFRRLNRIVRETNATDVTIDVIDGWYRSRNVYTQGTEFDGSFVPDEWQEESTVYNEVVKPFCRTCHVAKNDELGFTSAAEFKAMAGLIESAVCAAHSMPQAEITWLNFWRSSARAHLVGGLGLTTTCEGPVEP